MKKTLAFVVPVALCFGLGYMAGLLQTDSIHNWYPYLDKPELTPPNWAFPVAWSVIYLLSGLSAGIVWARAGAPRKNILILWCVQLLFNFLWSILFFTMRNPVLGFADIVILDILVLVYIIRTWSSNRTASILFWPYTAWLALATYLNFYIMIHN